MDESRQLEVAHTLSMHDHVIESPMIKVSITHNCECLQKSVSARKLISLFKFIFYRTFCTESNDNENISNSITNVYQIIPVVLYETKIVNKLL